MAKTGFATFLYHNADVAFTLQLATDLRNRGVNTFMDRLDIPPKNDWSTSSQNALNNCAILIMVISPDLMQSPFAKAALRRTADMRRPIIPVMLRPLNLTDYLTEVDYRTSIAMMGWQADHIYTTGLTHLYNAIQQTKAVRIDRTVDPELRYVHSLNMLIELYKSNLEVPLNAQELDEHALVLPPPRIEPNWGIGGAYLARGSKLNETSLISHLPYWASQTRRFVLMGQNGIGKTTTLFRLLSEHVHEYLRDSRHTPVPILADLSYRDPENDLNTFLMHQSRPIIDPNTDIAKGRMAVYMDGLSELGIYTEVKLAKIREWLHGKNAPQRVVIACDESLYTPRYGFNLPIVSVQDVTEGQRRTQVNSYMGRSARNFIEHLNAHPLGARWERNTMSLRSAMYFTKVRALAELPENTERLTIRVIEAMWEREQIQDNPDWMNFQDMLPRLAHFAYLVMTSGQPYSLTPEQAVQFLGSEGLLHALASARILQVRLKRVKFWHRSLLNVCAAYHLKNLPIHEQLAHTEFDEQGRRVSHHWDAPLVALTGVLDDPEAMLFHVADVDPYLAVEAIIGRDLRPEVVEVVLERFMQYAVEHQTGQFSATYHLLDALTLGKALPLVLKFMREGKWENRASAHDFLLRLAYPVAEDLAPIQGWDGVISDDLKDYFTQFSEEALPLLLRLLHLPNAQIRKGAVWALSVINDAAAAVGLVAALQDENADVRLAASQALRDIPHAGAATPLVERLHDEDWRVRKAATEALTALGTDAVPALRRLLASSHISTKRIAMGVLGRLGDLSVTDDLLPFVTDENADLRAISVIALGQLKDSRAVESLASRFADEVTPRWSKASISGLAQQALESIGTEDAMFTLGSFLGRKGSTKGKSGNKVKERIQQDKFNNPITPQPVVEEVVPAPLATVSHDTQETPVSAAPLPHQEEDDFDQILNGLHQPDWKLRERAASKLIAYARKLHKRYNPSILRRLEAGLYDDDSFIRENTVEALGHIADTSTTASLVNVLSDAIWTIRMNAMRALVEIGDSSVVPHITPMLKDRRAEVREVAAEVLGTFGRREAVAALIEALKDTDTFVRSSAIRSLGRIGDEGAIPALLTLLEQNNEEQQALIMTSLGKIGSPLAIQRLSDFLGSTYALHFKDGLTLGGVATTALEQIGGTAALKILAQRGM